MPAQDAIAFLKLHIDPLRATVLGPVIEVMESMLEIKSRPDFVGGALAPLDPIFEGEIGGIFNALGFLQRRSDNAAAPAGNGGCSAAGISLLQDCGFPPGPRHLDGRGYSRTSPANNRDINRQARVSHRMLLQTLMTEGLAPISTRGQPILRAQVIQHVTGKSRSSTTFAALCDRPPDKLLPMRTSPTE